MSTREQASAALKDLEAELRRLDHVEDARLRKIAVFSNVALALRESMPVSELDWLDAQLHQAAHGHGLPDDCVLPDDANGDDRPC